jgi:hypothetical protein
LQFFKLPSLARPLQVMQAPAQAIIFKLPYLAGPLQVMQAPAQASIFKFPSQIGRGGPMLGATGSKDPSTSKKESSNTLNSKK